MDYCFGISLKQKVTALRHLSPMKVSNKPLSVHFAHCPPGRTLIIIIIMFTAVGVSLYLRSSVVKSFSFTFCDVELSKEGDRNVTLNDHYFSIVSIRFPFLFEG